MREHEHHDLVTRWVAARERVALCPVIEGALVRYLVRLGERPSTATALFGALYASGRCEFWPDATSYADASLGHVTGHRMVTDAYIAALAGSRGTTVATLDRGFAGVLPELATLIG